MYDISKNTFVFLDDFINLFFPQFNMRCKDKWLQVLVIDKYINFHLSLMLFLNNQPFIYLFIFLKGGEGGGSSLVRFIIKKTCFDFFFQKLCYIHNVLIIQIKFLQHCWTILSYVMSTEVAVNTKNRNHWAILLP